MAATTALRHVGKSRKFRRQQGLSLSVCAVAAGVMPILAGVEAARGQTLYWDLNGATANGATTTAPGTWNALTTNWNADSSGAAGAAQTWTAGSIATFASGTNFTAGYNVTLSDTETIGGITFEEGTVTIGGAGSLNVGTAGVTIQTTHAGTNSIQVPIAGSGTLTIGNTSGGDVTINLDGQMSGFTGNIVVNAGTSAAALTKFQMDWATGDPTKTISLNSYTELSDNNQVTLSGGITTPNNITISNPIVLLGSNAWISSANGPTGQQKIATYAGAITGTGNLWIGIGNGGGKGAVVLAAQDSYAGDTYIVQANTNGLVQLGIDNALPSTTNLIFGTTTTGTGNFAPLDMNGHSLSVASLASTTTTTIAGILNTSSTPATLTLGGAKNASFTGLVGNPSAAFAPFNVNAPYLGNTTAYGNISLVKNGTGTQTLSAGGNTLAAVTVNGGTLKFSGAGNVMPTATVNSGGTLTFTSTNATSGALQGPSGGAAAVTVNSGGTLATGGGNVTLGAQITAAGGTIAPGGVGTVGTLVMSGGDLSFNSGATLGFDYSNATAYDQIISNGNINLDSGAHGFTFNLLAGTAITPGTYAIATASSINWDGTDSFPGGTIGAFNYGFTIDANHINLVITPNSPVLRWSVGGAVPAQEGDGDWSDGSGNFINLQGNTPATWSNSAVVDVIVGGDTNGGFGGTISLGSNVTVNGKLSLEPEIAGSPYTIGTGAGNTLTLNPSPNTPGLQADTSATINAPVILAASQSFTVNGGAANILTITQPVTQGAGVTATLTKNGSGTVALMSPGGNVSAVTVSGGTLALGDAGAVGSSTPITLDTGGILAPMSGITLLNPITVTAAGGGIGVNLGDTGTIAGNITASGTVTKAGQGVLTLTGTNTFTALTLGGGIGSEIVTGSTASLGAGTITLNNGGLRLTTPMTLTNNFVWTASSGNGLNDIFDTGSNAVTLAGSMSGAGDWHKLGGGTLTITGSSTAKGGALYVADGSTIVLENINALGLATIALDSNATFDVETANVLAADMRGNTATGVIAHKTGTGNLTLGSPGSSTPGGSLAGTTMSIDAGSITLDASGGLGGNGNNVDQLNVIINPGTQLIANFASAATTTDRVGGTVTLNGGSIILAATAPFAANLESNILQAYTQTTTAGVITSVNHANMLNVTASSLIENLSQSVDSTSHVLSFQGPIMVQPGATLTLDNENAGGNDSNNIIAIRGALDVTAFPNDSLTVLPGAKLVTAGPGQVRFGRSGSQGKVIVGQGTSASSESLIQFGTNAYLNDTGAASVITRFVVAGSGSAGLRIEAAMNATYRAATDTNPADHDGSTGLFTQAPSGGSSFTVLSTNRLNGLSTPFGSPAMTVGGTLTVAATNATDVVGGAMKAGPSAASPLTLAFDNTASSANANLTYQVDGSGTGGATIANFAHVQVEKTTAGTGSVKLQLAGNTKIADLVLLNSTAVNLQDKALAVDSPLATVQGYLASGKNGGLWNGPGINSSALAADTQNTTTMAMVLGTDLGLSGSATTTFQGLTIDANTVLLKPAYYGDINLDGRVDSDDYALMDRSVAKGLTADWIDGDFNGDGLVNSADYMLMDRSLGITNGGVLSPGLLAERQAEFGSGYVSALVASVPEPTMVSILGIGMVGMMARRRRGA